MAVTWLLVYRSFLSFFFKKRHTRTKSWRGFSASGQLLANYFVCVCVCSGRKKGTRLAGSDSTQHKVIDPTRVGSLSVYKEGQKKKKRKRNWDERAAPAYDEASGIRFSFRLFSLFFDELKKKEEESRTQCDCRNRSSYRDVKGTTYKGKRNTTTRKIRKKK